MGRIAHGNRPRIQGKSPLIPEFFAVKVLFQLGPDHLFQKHPGGFDREALIERHQGLSVKGVEGRLFFPDALALPGTRRRKIADGKFIQNGPLPVPALDFLRITVHGVQIAGRHVHQKVLRPIRALGHVDLMGHPVLKIVFELPVIAVGDADDGRDAAQIGVISAVFRGEDGNQFRVDARKAGEILDKQRQVFPLPF